MKVEDCEISLALLSPEEAAQFERFIIDDYVNGGRLFLSTCKQCLAAGKAKHEASYIHRPDDGIFEAHLAIHSERVDG